MQMEQPSKVWFRHMEFMICISIVIDLGEVFTSWYSEMSGATVVLLMLGNINQVYIGFMMVCIA